MTFWGLDSREVSAGIQIQVSLIPEPMHPFPHPRTPHNNALYLNSLASTSPATAQDMAFLSTTPMGPTGSPSEPLVWGLTGLGQVGVDSGPQQENGGCSWCPLVCFHQEDTEVRG